jgi:hypothetical protein
MLIMKKQITVALLSLLLATGCNSDKSPADAPVAPQASSTETDPMYVSEQMPEGIQSAGFTEIDSTGILMFPLQILGSENNSVMDKMSYGSRYAEANIWNYIFYNSHTGEQHLLTTEKMLIRQTQFGGSVKMMPEANDQSDFIFYEVIKQKEIPTENEDAQAPSALYVSDKQGKDFRQVSPVGMHLSHWQTVPSTHHIIMTCLQDSDGNKKFDIQKDAVFMYTWDPASDKPATEVLTDSTKKMVADLFKKHWLNPKK